MFKFLSEQQQSFRSRKIAEQLKFRQNNIVVANTVTFVALAENGTIDDVTAVEHTDLFSPWVVGIEYKVGEMRNYDDILYRCVQAHTSQTDWTPDITASLWVKVGDPAEEYPNWSQPIGSHDAYNTGDKVSFNGKHWSSTVDANVWQPGVYGWEEVE